MYTEILSQKLTLACQYRCCFPWTYQLYQEKLGSLCMWASDTCVQQVETFHHLPMLQENFRNLININPFIVGIALDGLPGEMMRDKKNHTFRESNIQIICLSSPVPPDKTFKSSIPWARLRATEIVRIRCLQTLIVKRCEKFLMK